MDSSPAAPLSCGFPGKEYWSGLTFPSPGDLPNPGIEPGSPTLQADSLLSELQGKPQGNVYLRTKQQQKKQSFAFVKATGGVLLFSRDQTLSYF